MKLAERLRNGLAKKTSSSSSSRRPVATERPERAQQPSTRKRPQALTRPERQDARADRSERSLESRSSQRTERADTILSGLSNSLAASRTPEATDQASDDQDEGQTVSSPTLESAVTRGENGELEVDVESFTSAFEDELRDDPNRAAELLRSYPEEFARLGEELNQDRRGSVESANFYDTLTESAESGSAANVRAITDWIESQEDVRQNPDLLNSVTQASFDGDTRLAERLSQRLGEDDAQGRSFSQAVSAGEAVRSLEGRVESGDLASLEEAVEEIQSLAEIGSPTVARAALERLNSGVLSDYVERLTDGGRDLGDKADFVSGLADLAGKADDQALTRQLALQLMPRSAPYRAEDDHQGRTDDQRAADFYRLVLGEAFENQIGQGGDPSLGLDMIRMRQQFDNVAPTDNRDLAALYTGVTGGFEERFSGVDNVLADVRESEDRLAVLTQNWGGAMTPEELEQATADFRQNNSEYSRLDEASARHVQDLEFLVDLRNLAAEAPTEHNVPSSLDSTTVPALRSEDRDRIDARLEGIVRSADLPQTREALNELVMSTRDGDASWLANRENLYSNASSAQPLNQGLEDALFNATTSGAAEYLANGETELATQLIEGYETAGLLSGVPTTEARAIVRSLTAVADFQTTGDLGAVQEAQETLNSTLEDLSDMAPETVSKLRLASGAIGIASLVKAGVDFQNDPTLRGFVDLGVTGTNVTRESYSILASRLGSDLPSGLTAAGRFAGGVNILLGGYDAANALAEGDTSRALIQAVGVAGGALALYPPTAPIGAILSAGSLVADLTLGQYRRVEASNILEGSDGRAFVRAALADSGLSESQLNSAVDALVNADSDGRQIGVLLETIADRTDGLSYNDLLNTLAAQDRDRLDRIVREAHGIDPTDSEDLASFDEEELQVWLDAVDGGTFSSLELPSRRRGGRRGRG